MKKLSMLLLCGLALWHMGRAQQQKHVILVTIDGFRPDFYLEQQWNTRHLHQLIKEGSYAYGVNSVFPSITYPSHTTIVTGVQPARHGIYYNGMFEADSSLKGKIYWHFNQIIAPTIWEVATKAGMTAASLMWPASAGVPDAFNLSDVGSMGYKTLEEYQNPKGVLDTLRHELFADAEKIEFGKDLNVAKIAAWVIKNKKPNVMTIHLFSVDHAEHTVGRSGKMVEEAIGDADSSVGIIQQAIKDAGMEDNTLFIVTGDHGFYNVTTSLNPNVLLHQAGLLDNPDNGQWKARFHAVGGSAFLFVRNNDAKVTKQVKELLEKLPADQKKYFRIVSSKEMRQIGADPNAVFALSGLNDAAFGGAYEGDFLKKGKGGTHGYFPDTRNIQTGFIAVGGNVKKGYEIKQMNLRDITAIMVQYLGLDMPTVEGKVPKGIW